jgi:hypothetical protein
VAWATVATAQSTTPSVLQRVQNVDDPELGELIRVALERRGDLQALGPPETLEIIRRVTLHYTQIKLLDRQIQEVARKLQLDGGPSELRHELRLAKIELEVNLANELAELREVMGIIPRHAFEEQPLEALNTWLHLNLIDQSRLHVLETQRPFSEYWAASRWKSLGVLAEGEVLDAIEGRLRDKGGLPIRFEILYDPGMGGVAEGLRDEIVSLAIEGNAQMEVEIHLQVSTWVGTGEAPFFVRDGQIRTLYPAPVQRPGGPHDKKIATGLVEPQELDQHILWRLTMPKNLPVTFRIEYDRSSFSQAQYIADEIRRLADALKVSELVDVNSVLVEPIPETIFLGQWRAMTPGEIQEIAIRPEGRAELLVPEHADRRAKTAKLPAPWTLATTDIFIETGYDEVYWGQIDSEGHLVLEKGKIFPQGSWHDAGGPPIVFEKVPES